MVEFGDLLLKITVGSFLALVLQTKKASVLGGFFDGILVVGEPRFEQRPSAIIPIASGFRGSHGGRTWIRTRDPCLIRTVL